MFKKYPFLSVIISAIYFGLTAPLLLFILFLHIHSELLLKTLFLFGIILIMFFQIGFTWFSETKKILIKKFLIVLTLIFICWDLVLYFEFLPYLKNKYSAEYMVTVDSESREDLENVKMFSYLLYFFGISISILAFLISSVSALILHFSIRKDSR